MTSKFNLSDQHNANVEPINSSVELSLGQWAVVRQTDDDWIYDAQGLLVENNTQTLCCISEIGSNYFEFVGPKAERGGQAVFRIHQVEFWSRVKLISESTAQAMIERQVGHFQQNSANLLGEIKKLTAALGISKAMGIEHSQSQQTDSTGLLVINSQNNIDQYQLSLETAKKDLLPAMYEDLKKSNQHLMKWLSASSLSTLCQITDMQDHIKTINDRLFSLTLYAGLCENLVKVREGNPAAIDAKLHVMQRRCYMDEECLVNYKAGGMSFKQISQFDQWLSEKENFERVLPHDRCVVAFRVRRKDADRPWDGSLLGAFIHIQMAEADKKTFLYFRNGEQLWRLETEIEFGELIFPDSTVFDPSEPMMFKMFGSKVDKFISKREYEQLKAERERKEAENEQWEQENPYEVWKESAKNNSRHSYEWAKPHTFFACDLDQWQELTSESVYFDDAIAVVQEEFKRYNRIATVLQGVFDRSEALHPHPPAQLWTAHGFSQLIELVYDGTKAIAHGEKPDIEAYIQECNASMGVGSTVIGQLDYWLKAEAKKEMKRRQNDWRLSESERYRELSRYEPFGNPGPKEIAAIEHFKPKSKVATFKWDKESARFPYRPIECSINVPASELFNISAYRPGDFKQFFQDHRTRQEYLKWAPFLLAAEDWHAQKGHKEQ